MIIASIITASRLLSLPIAFSFQGLLFIFSFWWWQYLRGIAAGGRQQYSHAYISLLFMMIRDDGYADDLFHDASSQIYQRTHQERVITSAIFTFAAAFLIRKFPFSGCWLYMQPMPPRFGLLSSIHLQAAALFIFTSQRFLCTTDNRWHYRHCFIAFISR